MSPSQAAPFISTDIDAYFLANDMRDARGVGFFDPTKEAALLVRRDLSRWSAPSVEDTHISENTIPLIFMVAERVGYNVLIN